MKTEGCGKPDNVTADMVAVDADLCCWFAACVVTAPDVFELIGGKSSVRGFTPGQDQTRLIHLAVADCPTGAISLWSGSK